MAVIVYKEGRRWLSLHPSAIKGVTERRDTPTERRSLSGSSRSFPTRASSIVDFVPRFSYSLHALPHFLSVTHSAVRRDASWPTRATLNTTPTLTQPRVGEAGPRSWHSCMCHAPLSVCADPCSWTLCAFPPSQEVDRKRACSHGQESPQSGWICHRIKTWCVSRSSYITCRAHRRQSFSLSFFFFFPTPAKKIRIPREIGAKWGEATRGGSREERSLRLGHRVNSARVYTGGGSRGGKGDREWNRRIVNSCGTRVTMLRSLYRKLQVPRRSIC